MPLLVGGPLIVGIALWRSAGLLAAGGGLDQAYERVDRAMAPLGLSVTETPTITIDPRYIAPLRFGPKIRGELVVEGERHGRPVHVRMGQSTGAPNSTRWNGVHGGGGEDGIAVERKGAQQGDWLLDLWVAERLADAMR